MSKRDKSMSMISAMAVVFAGGGLGALCRMLVGTGMKSLFDVPGYVAIIVINVTGCFLIGFLFLIFEVQFRRDGQTRLHGTPIQERLGHLPGLFIEDDTIHELDRFRADMHIGFFSDMLLTGFLGGFTTFSTFSLHSLQLFQNGETWQAVANIAVSVVCGVGATGLGLMAAHKIMDVGLVKRPLP